VYQKVVVVGRLGADPIMRYTPQGKAVVNFSVAVDRYTGPGTKDTTWFRVNAWEKQAEAVNEYLHKGDLCLCEGEVSVSTFEGRDGKARASLDLRARQVTFLQTKKDTEGMAGVESKSDLDDEEILF